MTRSVAAAIVLLAVLLAFGLATAPPAQTVRAAALHEARATDAITQDAIATRADAAPAVNPGRTAASSLTISGVVSWADDGFGPLYFAISPFTGWREGTRVRMCGPAGCAELTSNDTGPVRRLERLGDIPAVVFEAICYDRSFGLCQVTFTRIAR